MSVCLILLAACSQSPHKFQLTNVTGHQADLALFQTPTATGKVLTAKELHGKVVVLYFGYTHCPDICPTTLATFHAVEQRLSTESSNLSDDFQVIFVTVDPKRDTPEVLEHYMRSFSPRFIAVRPDSAVLSKMMSRYHMTYSYGKPDASGNYAVNHTSQFLIFDQKGQMRLIGNYGDSVEAITNDVTYLIKHPH
ncbi:MAG TPA: SCO family protein [Nitrococcus sp.]|nr:SCO family protein [Nitrococcus sp.]